MFLLPHDSWEMRKRVYKNSQNEKKQNRGIFAKKDIEPGTIIGDYLGLVIPEHEEDKYEDNNEMYLMYYTEGVTIYPDPQTPGVHILNHSCEPNSWMYTYKGHTLYFSLRKIYKGEELTVSYQLSPIDSDCEPCIHTCHCHAPTCTGSMHMTEEKYDAWRSFDDKETAKTKTVSAPVKQHLSLLDNYPKEIKDHAIYKLFGSTHKAPMVMSGNTFPTLKEIRKLIRKTGRQLKYPKLGIIISGTEGKQLFLQSTN